MNPVIMLGAVAALALYALTGNAEECREAEGVVRVVKNDEDSVVVEIEERDEDAAVCRDPDPEPETDENENDEVRA